MKAPKLKKESIDIEWKNIVFSEEFLDRVERLAKRRLYNPTLAEEAITYTIEKLSEDNHSRLNSFQGNCQPLTFLHKISTNLIEEFARKKLGRPRPPEWIKGHGPEWVRLWKMIALRQLSKKEILEYYSIMLNSDKQMNSKLTNLEEVSSAISKIKAKLPWCGHHHEEINFSSLSQSDQDIEVETLPGLSQKDTSPESYIAQREYDSTLQLLNQILDNQSLSNESVTSGIPPINPEKYEQLKGTIDLKEEELKALKLIYVKGYNKTKTAKTLSISAKRLSNILNRALHNLQEGLRSIDISIQHIGIQSTRSGWV